MRSEDFFNFVIRVNKERQELLIELKRVKEEYKDKSIFTQNQAKAAFTSSLFQHEQNYGTNFDAQSHGESFLKLFEQRFTSNGLYLLDEPEAPLSPIRQYSLLMQIRDKVKNENSQFIISTHSPILMAYPDAQILNLDQGLVIEQEYDELEHVSFMKDFLNSPKRYLQHLN